MEESKLFTLKYLEWRKKVMKKYIFASTPIILGVLSFLIFMMKGSNVAPDGTLEEPFFLIPIGFLLLFIGFICVVGVALISVIKKHNTLNNNI